MILLIQHGRMGTWGTLETVYCSKPPIPMTTNLHGISARTPFLRAGGGHGFDPGNCREGHRGGGGGRSEAERGQISLAAGVVHVQTKPETVRACRGNQVVPLRGAKIWHRSDPLLPPLRSCGS